LAIFTAAKDLFIDILSGVIEFGVYSHLFSGSVIERWNSDTPIQHRNRVY